MTKNSAYKLVIMGMRQVDLHHTSLLVYVHIDSLARDEAHDTTPNVLKHISSHFQQANQNICSDEFEPEYLESGTCRHLHPTPPSRHSDGSCILRH